MKHFLPFFSLFFDSPDDTSDHDGVLSAQSIRQGTRNQSSQPGASSHGGGDTSLDERPRTTTFAIGRGWGVLILVEVAEIRLLGQLGRHRRNVEAEERAADDGHAGNHVDVADSHGSLLMVCVEDLDHESW